MRKIKNKNILSLFPLLIVFPVFVVVCFCPIGKAINKETKTDSSVYEVTDTYCIVQENLQNKEENFNNEELIIGNIHFDSLEDIANNKYQKKNIDTNDIIFVGNSLVEGLKIYSNDNNVYLCKVGINLNGLKSDIYKKLKNYNCNNVIIGMGTNELGSYSEKTFKDSYMNLVNHIYSINKNATIICLSIPPVSENKSKNDKLFNNYNVELYNSYIENLCNENGLYYIDNSAFFGNVLNKDWTGDGIHMSRQVYKNWYNFIIEEISKL